MQVQVRGKGVVITDALRDYASSDADNMEVFLDGLDDTAKDQVSDALGFDLLILSRVDIGSFSHDRT